MPASRALSPAVNDPGTAIDVIGRAMRIFSIWAQSGKSAAGRSASSCRAQHPRSHQVVRHGQLGPSPLGAGRRAMQRCDAIRAAHFLRNR
ncbi:DUF2254 family protein [Paraburkholderia kirstenboschensis]|uniref:DUF2254 family protein n=1 Tax=Paraburkholderia kirstenboschensis TaxID=1245436 RepID=A0ABZ0EH48_9BURK|nr:DUF2254 family protein [Paraburkholderia kirstenboschensis]WOD15884.1 DUF2254 family protein [Paraburkholderia kirstenboschensis]